MAGASVLWQHYVSDILGDEWEAQKGKGTTLRLNSWDVADKRQNQVCLIQKSVKHAVTRASGLIRAPALVLLFLLKLKEPSVALGVRWE